MLKYAKDFSNTSKRLTKKFEIELKKTDNINEQDPDTRDTFLHQMARQNYLTGIKLILERKNINVNILNLNGKNPLYILIEKREEYGANGKKSQTSKASIF